MYNFNKLSLSLEVKDRLDMKNIFYMVHWFWYKLYLQIRQSLQYLMQLFRKKHLFRKQFESKTYLLIVYSNFFLCFDIFSLFIWIINPYLDQVNDQRKRINLYIEKHFLLYSFQLLSFSRFIFLYLHLVSRDKKLITIFL